MFRVLRIALIVIAMCTVVCVAQDASEKLDCFSFLQGTQKAVGKDYKPDKMSELEAERATRVRVCIMTFVQLDTLRPILLEDPQSAAKLAKIDQLYKLKRSLVSGSQEWLVADEKLDEEIHALFKYVASLPPERLAVIANTLRDKKSQVRSEGHNPLQAELLARYVEVRALERQNRSPEIPAVVEELRTHSEAGSLVDNGRVDDVERGTYFRPETLWSAITAYDLKSRAMQSAGKPEVISITSKYLGLPESSLGITHAPGLDELIVPLTRSLRVVASSANNIAAVRSVDGVAGVEDSGGHIDIYLEGQNGLSAKVLRYSRSSSYVEILDALPVFQADISKAVSQYSTPQMRLTSVIREGEHYAIQVAGKQFTLTSGELQTLRDGDPLGPDSAISRELLAHDSPVVIYSNPLMHDRSTYLKEAEDVAFAIQHAYPSVQVFRDDFNSKITPQRVHAIEQFRVPDTSHLIAVIAEDSFKVDDKRLIQNIQKTLRAHGGSIKSWKYGQAWDGGSDRAVIVITGHIDEQLATYVRQLGHSGVFKGNYVVFGSCYGELSSILIREINNDFQAVGTFRFEGKISPYALQDALTDLTERIEHGQGKFGFSDVLQKSLHTTDLKGIWTVCQIEMEAISRG
jgi:hypothetical protein